MQEVNSTLPSLFDEETAASRLGLSRRTLQAWRLVGGGPVYRKIGRRVFYAEPDLAVFVADAARSHTSQGVRA